MDEQHKKVLCIAAAVVVLFTIAFVLFGRTDVPDYRGTADDVGEQLNNIGTEQQQAADAIDQVADGLADSIGSVGSIEQSGLDAAATADRIAETNYHLTESVANAAAGNSECQNILKDSERRITESRSILQAVRNTPAKNTAAP